MFSKESNKKILNEIFSLENEFKEATLGKGIDIEMRNNTVLYCDMIYGSDRSKSDLLNTIDKMFSDDPFREMLASSPYPLCDFGLTNYHETQVSRYGSGGEKYDWHIDRFSNKSRHLSLVYYCYKEPEIFTGGILQITSSPIADGEPIIENPEIIEIKPVNNRLVIFSSTIAHRVLPTNSSQNFEDGRFSVQIWVGLQ